MSTANTTARCTAAELNAHLAAGGLVQVATYTRSTLYSKAHAGWFSESSGGNLKVRHGRGSVQLSNGPCLLVSVRTGRRLES
jgi:hypothetical protein